MHKFPQSSPSSALASETRNGVSQKTSSGMQWDSRILGVAIALLLLTSSLTIAQESDAAIEGALKSVADRRDVTWQIAQKIWLAAEPGYQETVSSALLADAAEAAGLKVTRGVAEIPTAFMAEFGSGKPVIGLLGEFDALPGLSQQAVPEPLSRDDGNSFGHGCGHHLFGSASLSATIAIAEQIKAGTINGTVRFYGCPAEEGGSAKVFMVEAGLFKDCDAVMHWHPSSKTSAGDRSSLARVAVKFQFRGRTAHAAGSPEQGRSALDAVELTNHAAELMREHTPEATRIHHVITSGGTPWHNAASRVCTWRTAGHPNAAFLVVTEEVGEIFICHILLLRFVRGLCHCLRISRFFIIRFLNQSEGDKS